MRKGSDHVGVHSCFFIMTHIDCVTQNIRLVSKSTLIILGTYFQIPAVSSRSFDHRTASRILLDAKVTVNNGTSYFNKGFY